MSEEKELALKYSIAYGKALAQWYSIYLFILLVASMPSMPKGE